MKKLLKIAFWNNIFHVFNRNDNSYISAVNHILYSIKLNSILYSKFYKIIKLFWWNTIVKFIFDSTNTYILIITLIFTKKKVSMQNKFE